MKKLKEILLSEKRSKLQAERTKFINKINKRIDKTIEELEKVCTHSQTEVINHNREGGYDYVAEYKKITRCTICYKELKTVITTGGYS